MLVVVAVPGFVKPYSTVQLLIFNEGQNQDPPTVQRLALFVHCVEGGKCAVGVVIIVERKTDLFLVIGTHHSACRFPCRKNGGEE
jgi:hypothetical protein